MADQIVWRVENWKVLILWQLWLIYSNVSFWDIFLTEQRSFLGLIGKSDGSIISIVGVLLFGRSDSGGII